MAAVTIGVSTKSDYLTVGPVVGLVDHDPAATRIQLVSSALDLVVKRSLLVWSGLRLDPDVKRSLLALSAPILGNRDARRLSMAGLGRRSEIESTSASAITNVKEGQRRRGRGREGLRVSPGVLERRGRSALIADIGARSRRLERNRS